MHATPFASLACPLDGLQLTKHNKHYQCANKHSFDIARQGYVNLLPSQDKRSKHPGDSKEMIEARQRFLDSGVYAPISNAVNDYLLATFGDSERDQVSVLDAGCGEGYYLQKLYQDALQHPCEKRLSLVGMDISKPGILAASRREKQSVTWVVGTNRNIPVVEQSLDMILCMFGFPVFEAFRKAIRDNGKVILVESGPDHLIELREQLYDEVRRTPLPEHPKAAESGFSVALETPIRFQSRPLSQSLLNDLLIMTPHFFKAPRERRQAVSQLQDVCVTIDVRLRVFDTSTPVEM